MGHLTCRVLRPPRHAGRKADSPSGKDQVIRGLGYESRACGIDDLKPGLVPGLSIVRQPQREMGGSIALPYIGADELLRGRRARQGRGYERERQQPLI